MTDRRIVDTINDAQLSQLYDNLERAEAANARVRALTDQWIKAGPPPLGTPVARWWDRRLVELNTALDDAHICKPGATVYYCPASRTTESDCHGGFDQCCDRPEEHRPVSTVLRDHLAAALAEPKDRT